jgi:hypothetical protein
VVRPGSSPLDCLAIFACGPDSREYLAMEFGTPQLTIDDVEYKLNADDNI